MILGDLFRSIKLINIDQ